MEDVIHIYHNDFGISFRWKQLSNETPKIQLIFRDTGFYLTSKEMVFFKKQILNSLFSSSCHQCSMQEHCRSKLLRTPMDNVDIAISDEELKLLLELVEGTLFYDGFSDTITQLLQ